MFTTDNGDEQLEEPYACTATDPNKRCKLMFNMTGIDSADYPKDEYVDVLCKCSLKD